MVGQWNGLTVGPGRVTGRVFGWFRSWVPQAQMFEYAVNEIRFIDDGNDAHGVVTFWTFKRVDLVDFLDEPGPVGLQGV